MTDGQTLYSMLQETMREAYDANESLVELGREKAEAEAAYRSAVAKKELELRVQGKLPMGLIHDLARGDEHVAVLFVEKECSAVLYDKTREEVLLRKRDADIIREQIAREYGRNEMP